MRPSPESVSRKSFQNMLYDELFIALRLQPSPQFRVPTLKGIRELSKELASRLIRNHQFIETVDLIGKMQTTGGFQRNKPKNAPKRIQTESGP